MDNTEEKADENSHVVRLPLIFRDQVQALVCCKICLSRDLSISITTKTMVMPRCNEEVAVAVVGLLVVLQGGFRNVKGVEVGACVVENSTFAQIKVQNFLTLWLSLIAVVVSLTGDFGKVRGRNGC